MHTHSALVLVVSLAGPASAQLTDLQPGRNFPVAEQAFGNGSSENIDVGDADRDGDLDVIVGNGGDFGAQVNAFFLNQGGIQGGVEGSFVDATAARFLAVPADTTRDIEFADWDGDADLDVFVANTGPVVNGGEASRAYRNLGGRQLGAIGFYVEDTDSFWGDLVDVPLTSEVDVQDGMGPFRDFVCDCDFGDFDDDGDLDLFHASYGPGINGAFNSRIFLNDGTGRFDELWPWANASADIKTHALDIDITDLDGDFDLDVFASSRNSQSRVYRNNLSNGAWSGDPFDDITQTALIHTGATQTGTAVYEVEFGDIDGDGDFDAWMVNYQGFKDVVLRNDGGLFTKMEWIKGDPNQDESELDFLDYDGDGDLDGFSANFSGTNRIYQSGLAEGLSSAQGLMHRTGDGLSLPPEVPETANSGTTLDGECADLDGDGDTDILLANESNQANRYWENVLGVPDTHAPTFHTVTTQPDKTDGSDTIIHAAVRDNDPDYIVAYHQVDLIYSVDGASDACVQMASQGGQQFRGVIPGELSGTIAYRVVATDGTGNTGVSATVSYVQTSAGAPLWQNLGCGTTGVAGDAYLELSGAQVGGQPVTLQLRDAAPNAFFLTWLSFSSTPFAALGGEVFAFPFATQVLAVTDAGGMFTASTNWPGGVPPGTEAWWQAIVQDASSVHGLVLSNAVKSTSP